MVFGVLGFDLSLLSNLGLHHQWTWVFTTNGLLCPSPAGVFLLVGLWHFS